MVNNSVCDALCMNPWCAFDGGDCLTAKIGWPFLDAAIPPYDSNGDGALSYTEYMFFAFNNSDTFPSSLSSEDVAAYQSSSADGTLLGLSSRQLSLLHVASAPAPMQGELAALLPAIALVWSHS